MEEWIKFKIYPKLYEDLQKTGTELLPQLKNLDDEAPTYHCYYPDNKKLYPEGFHIKVYVKTNKIKEFEIWKAVTEKIEFIEKIELENEGCEDSEGSRECSIAGKIFWGNKGKIDEIKADERFISLVKRAKSGNEEAKIGLHFLCCMLGIQDHLLED